MNEILNKHPVRFLKQVIPIYTVRNNEMFIEHLTLSPLVISLLLLLPLSGMIFPFL